LQSKDSDVGKLKKVKIDENIAITPLAIPIITGPGTIVTGMNFISNASVKEHILIILIFGVMCYLNYLAFTLSDIIVKKIGNNIIDVIGKIMGLIIAIIGTTMIIEGIKTSFNLI
jgi:multiple antibiotic resistance protein